MELLKNYLLSVVAAATLCCIIRYLVGSKLSVSPIIRLLSGLFFLCVVLKPVFSIDFSEITFDFQSLQGEAEAAVRTGQSAASEKLSADIISRTEAYILDKATQWEVDLAVEVSLTDITPSHVRIFGSVSPYVKAALSDWIAEQLGISKEEQEWIGLR